MARKKIVFVIVEGPSDDTALSLLLSQIYNEQTVHVHIMHRDITPDKGITSSNIITKVCDELKQYAVSTHLKSSHFQEIIHLVDMDGAYIPPENVVDDQDCADPCYSVTEIRTCNKSGIELRNQQKKLNLDKLCSCKKIWGVPYRVFYMSCNLDHVLYNKLNSTDAEKEGDAFNFARQYKGKTQEFVQFISNSDFSVMDGYQESWKYIKQGVHSLERHTNFGLCFTETASTEDTTEDRS